MIIYVDIWAGDWFDASRPTVDEDMREKRFPYFRSQSP